MYSDDELRDAVAELMNDAAFEGYSSVVAEELEAAKDEARDRGVLV